MACGERVRRARWCRKVVVLLGVVVVVVFVVGSSSEGGRDSVRSMKGEMKRSRVRMPRV